jgi:segregation and condensation protein B
MDNLDKILEGLLFLAGDGLDRGVIMEKLQVTPKQLDKAIETLKQRYNADCGINMITYKDKLQLCASPKYADDVSLVLNPIRERQLTKATLEVMAIIAYKQPVTRLDVQDIRGINSDYAIQTLLNYKLIEVVGRKDAIGKPLLFGTTDEFLRHFGINDLSELPDYDELMKNVQKIQLENNHLYNEYDVPDHRGEDDEQKPQDEQKSLENADINKVNNGIDDKAKSDKDAVLQKDRADETDNNKNKLTASNSITEQSKQTEALANTKKQNIEVEPINDIKNQKISQAKQVAEDNKNGEENAVDNINNKPNNTQATGIDWSLLEDNPDIEN